MVAGHPAAFLCYTPPMKLKHFAGKTAVVTGAASGLGRLITLALANEGISVAAWDRDEKALLAFGTEARDRKLPVRGWAVDISNRASVYAAAASVASSMPPVAILVNCAGIVSGKTFMDTPDDKIERTMSVNATALFWTAKAFLPGMLERKEGHIITLASAAGIIGVRGLADYSASKFAAFGFNESLRMELRRQKSPVRTTIVCPFFIDTGMFAGVRTRFPLLLPILKPAKVVKRILSCVGTRKKELIIPPFVRSVRLLRLFPVGLFDALADFFGVNASMDNFKGRN